MIANTEVSKKGLIMFEHLQVYMQPGSASKALVRVRNLEDYGNEEVR